MKDVSQNSKGIGVHQMGFLLDGQACACNVLDFGPDFCHHVLRMIIPLQI